VSDYLPILLIFALASTYGIWYQASRGKVKAKKNRATKNPLLENEVGGEFGSRATFIQFSSAFCTPCRATRALLSDITADLDDVKHIEIDAEKNLLHAGQPERCSRISLPILMMSNILRLMLRRIWI